MAAVLDNIGQLKDLSTKDRKKIEEEQKKREALTSFFTKFEDTIKRFRAALEETFLSSDLFKTITRLFDKFLKPGDAEGSLDKVLKEIQGIFDRFLTWMNTFLIEVETPNSHS